MKKTNRKESKKIYFWTFKKFPTLNLQVKSNKDEINNKKDINEYNKNEIKNIKDNNEKDSHEKEILKKKMMMKLILPKENHYILFWN